MKVKCNFRFDRYATPVTSCCQARTFVLFHTVLDSAHRLCSCLLRTVRVDWYLSPRLTSSPTLVRSCSLPNDCWAFCCVPRLFVSLHQQSVLQSYISAMNTQQEPTLLFCCLSQPALRKYCEREGGGREREKALGKRERERERERGEEREREREREREEKRERDREREREIQRERERGERKKERERERERERETHQVTKH